MVEIMTHYLRHWFQAKDTSYTHRLIPTININRSLLHNIKNQTEIGWDHFIRGKIAISWSKTQTMYKPNTKHHTWRKKLITFLIQASNKIWEIRNLLNFGTPNLNQSGEKKLEPIILHYYTHYCRIIHHTHHHLFNTP